jgi:hypothetical protein
MTRSGYVDCGCRDCFDVAISADAGKAALCQECAAAGCETYSEDASPVRNSTHECQRAGAYDADNDPPRYVTFMDRRVKVCSPECAYLYEERCPEPEHLDNAKLSPAEVIIRSVKAR